LKKNNQLINNNFYAQIEEGVREWVFKLRNSGINTECSCHHEGYIQCQCLDPTTEISVIQSLFLEHNIEDFTIDVKVQGVFKSLEIRSPIFNSSYRQHKILNDSIREVLSKK
jgi:hypothetical protein